MAGRKVVPISPEAILALEEIHSRTQRGRQMLEKARAELAKREAQPPKKPQEK